jgi:hypothetical protein
VFEKVVGVILLLEVSLMQAAYAQSLQENIARRQEDRRKMVVLALDQQEWRSQMNHVLSASVTSEPLVSSESAEADLGQDADQTVEPLQPSILIGDEGYQKVSPLVREDVVRRELDHWELTVQMSSGLRLDQLNWRIAGNIQGMNPNILSELKWEELQIYQVGTKAHVTWNRMIRLEGGMDYGWIYRGRNQDSDYLGNNRTLEFSRSNNAADGDDVFDISAGLGYQLGWHPKGEWRGFLGDELQIALLGGYSYHEQNLRITNGFQTIPATGPFAGLNSSYLAEWRGPWVGIEFLSEHSRFRGFSRFEYHMVEYDAEGNWNLRSDFAHPVSFTHDADGLGILFSTGGEVALTKAWTLGMKFQYQDWETDTGVDRTFFANGTTSDTKFQGTEWRSYALLLAASTSLPWK